MSRTIAVYQSYNLCLTLTYLTFETTVIAVYVRYNSLYISLLFSAKQQREMTKFCVFRRTQTSTISILDFLVELIAGITYII